MTESHSDRLPIHFKSRGPELRVGDVLISDLAEAYGTPLFVYDRAIMESKLETLRGSLPAGFEIYYSVKANPNLAIVRHFVMRGCGLEIASEGELLQALAAGCPVEQIVFAGPGKSDKELDVAIRKNIGEIHVESMNEAIRIASICNRLALQANVSVRVNPTGESQGGAMRMGGKPAPFGIDEENLSAAIRFLSSEPCFEFRGIHMFAGTQILDAAVLASQYRRCIQIARRVSDFIGRPLRTVDFGGGLGVPYYHGENVLDLQAYKEEIKELFDEVRLDDRFRNARFLIEPGRFLVAEAGVYVTRIVDIKESRGKTFVILDGGMNHHLAASGNLGQTIKRNYPIMLLQGMDRPPNEQVDVVGPLCTPLDTVGRNVAFPKAEIGNLVGIFQSGAYARAASPLGFLSHPTPPEVWVDRGDHCLIRTRGLAEDAMKDVRLPEAMAISV